MSLFEARIRDDSGAEAYNLAEGMAGVIAAPVSGVTRRMSGLFRGRVDPERLVTEREFL
jgi:hypothetical protein